MKMRLLLNAVFIIVLATNSFGQNVGIGTTTPAGSAALDVESTTKGFLPPRMTTAQRTTIASPVAGLLTYDTDTDSYWYYDGADWAELANGGAGATKYKVGDWALGGVVAWVDDSEEHGFVLCKNRLSNCHWSSGTTGLTRALGNGIGAGQINTAIIIAANVRLGDNGHKYAARICNEYETNVSPFIKYSDWYLPSKKEVEILYDNRVVLDSTLDVHGGTCLACENYRYWTSTEANATKAWVHRFQTNGKLQYDKEGGNGNADVRAIRRF